MSDRDMAGEGVDVLDRDTSRDTSSSAGAYEILLRERCGLRVDRSASGDRGDVESVSSVVGVALPVLDTLLSTLKITLALLVLVLPALPVVLALDVLSMLSPPLRALLGLPGTSESRFSRDGVVDSAMGV